MGPCSSRTGKIDRRTSGWEASGAGEMRGPGSAPTWLVPEDLVAEPAGVEVVEHWPAGGAPERVVAALDVVAECLTGEGGWLWQRDTRARGTPLGLDVRHRAFGIETGPLREVLKRLADAEAGGFEEQVDGGAAGATGVAVPALVAAGGGEDADGGCAAGLGSVVR